MAKLFGRNKLKEYASAIPTEEIETFISIIKAWQNDYHSGSLKFDKETSREQAYNNDFFIKILGYNEKPENPYSFEPKSTTTKLQIPDATISYNGENYFAVVELKDASTSLDKPQRREGNMSPVQQAFKYKTQYKKCPFVIVSNFYEFRLYQDNQLDYEIWTLDDLADPSDDYLLFKEWFYLLKSDNFISKNGQSKTELLLSEVRLDQEEISKKFYEEYREVRLNLLRDIYRRNSRVRRNIDLGIEKAQKIIDRIVFCCFAEDVGLLPDDILYKVKKTAENSAFGGSLWNTLKGFFETIDKGSDKLEIPHGYDGGLFKSDPLLNELKISDESLEKIIDLSRFDFKEDLSVNILGHIFEQSISDLEGIRSKAIESCDIEANSTDRRKKDGIFYTPDSIVRYIIEKSLGTYLRNKERDFIKEAGLKNNIKDKNYEKREKIAYFKYQEFLQNIKVVDPACGSGAFLVCVFDYLLAENKRVSDILGTLYTDDYAKNILQNNIFGVDINQESVEITKLSLWLKSAQKGKRLTSLDKNILCGNSLVADKMVDSDKAFDWQNNFKEIFKDGGFDIVVMNPPYVDSESMIKHLPEQRRYISEHYEFTKGNWDMYVAFIELSVNIMKENGYCSFISPDKWLAKPFGEKLRSGLIESIETITYAGRNIFTDAKIDSIIVSMKKRGKSNAIKFYELCESKAERINTIDKKSIESPFRLDGFKTRNLAIVKKVSSIKHTISDMEIFTESACATSDAYKLQPLVEDRSALPNDMKMVNTGTIGKFITKWGDSPMKYLGKIYLRPVVNTERFLAEFPNSYGKKAKRPKLIIKGLTLLDVYFDEKAEYIPGKSTLLVFSDDIDNLKVIQVFLNARLPIFFIKNKYCGSSYNGGINFTKDMINNFPIPILSKATRAKFITAHDKYNKLYSELQKYKRNWEMLTQSKVSDNWYKLEFADRIKTIKRNITLREKDELLALYNKYQPVLDRIASRLSELDREINHEIYKLYGITSNEISIIEHK